MSNIIEQIDNLSKKLNYDYDSIVKMIEENAESWFIPYEDNNLSYYQVEDDVYEISELLGINKYENMTIKDVIIDRLSLIVDTNELFEEWKYYDFIEPQLVFSEPFHKSISFIIYNIKDKEFYENNDGTLTEYSRQEIEKIMNSNNKEYTKNIVIFHHS